MRMRPNLLSILAFFALLCAAAAAEETVPPAAARLLPNIKASIDDGFYALAEQQARGVSIGGPGPALN